MKIDLYSTIYNEEQILPYWLRHYDNIADRIFVWDDASTDATREILSQNPKVIFLPREKPGVDDEYYVNHLFPQYEKYSRGVADWVMIADPDEFIYHPKLKEKLAEIKAQGYQAIQCTGFSMIADSFPTTSGQIYDEIKLGLPDEPESKWAIHSPEIRIRFKAGRHRPVNARSYNVARDSGVKMLHYRYLGAEYINDRDEKNYAGYRRASYDRYYDPNAPRLRPDNRYGDIFKWLEKNKKQAIRVI